MHLHEILTLELARFGDQSLHVVETGTLRDRSEAGRIGDGWSTIWFAERALRVSTVAARLGSFISIDLDVSVAKELLTQMKLLEVVTLVELHSITALTRDALRRGAQTIDVFLLDSDNDPELIFHEFLIAHELIKTGGVILVDDVAFPDREPTGAKKGELVLPYVRDNLKLSHRIHERVGWNGYLTGMLVVDC